MSIGSDNAGLIERIVRAMFAGDIRNLLRPKSVPTSAISTVNPDATAGTANDVLTIDSDGFASWQSGAGVVTWDQLEYVLAEKADEGHDHRDYGYALHGAATVLAAPVDSTNYHFGSPFAVAPQTSAGGRPIYIPHDGFIVSAVVHWLSGGTAGSGQAVTANVLVNGTTATTIASIADTAATKIFNNYAMRVWVKQGDYIEFRVDGPVWTTNPTNVYLNGHVVIERK